MEVWGTFAVNDHMPRGAFLREVLLFDRLVVPVPSSDAERVRWWAPNPIDADESWDPERQDELLAELGTRSEPGYNGAQLVVRAPWDQDRWLAARAKPEVAEMIHNESVWQATRMVVAQDESVPAAVEAIAAYPSAGACHADVHPVDDSSTIDGPEALMMLTRPMLVPELGGRDEIEALREAIDLAAELRDERAAYHRWLRDFVGASRLGEIVLDAESVNMASDELGKLIKRERAPSSPGTRARAGGRGSSGRRP